MSLNIKVTLHGHRVIKSDPVWNTNLTSHKECYYSKLGIIPTPQLLFAGLDFNPSQKITPLSINLVWQERGLLSFPTTWNAATAAAAASRTFQAPGKEKEREAHSPFLEVAVGTTTARFFLGGIHILLCPWCHLGVMSSWGSELDLKLTAQS